MAFFDICILYTISADMETRDGTKFCDFSFGFSYGAKTNHSYAGIWVMAVIKNSSFSLLWVITQTTVGLQHEPKLLLQLHCSWVATNVST